MVRGVSATRPVTTGDAHISMTELGTKETEVARDEGDVFAAVQLAPDFLLILPLGPPDNHP